jgi:hypothetical protein
MVERTASGRVVHGSLLVEKVLAYNKSLSDKAAQDPKIIRFKQWLKDNGAVWHKVSNAIK